MSIGYYTILHLNSTRTVRQYYYRNVPFLEGKPVTPVSKCRSNILQLRTFDIVHKPFSKGPNADPIISQV